MDELGGVVAFFLFFVFVFGGFDGNSPRYQVESCGSQGAIVLDIHTGEAWRTEGLGNLKPINYSQKQIESATYGYYTIPEDTRSDSNVSWGTYIKRKFQGSKKKTR